MPISKSVTIPINQHLYQLKYLILASDNDKSPRLIAFPVQGEVDHFLRHLQSKQISPLQIFTQFKNLSVLDLLLCIVIHKIKIFLVSFLHCHPVEAFNISVAQFCQLYHSFFIETPRSPHMTSVSPIISLLLSDTSH